MNTSKLRNTGAAFACALFFSIFSLASAGGASAATTIGDSLAGSPYPGTDGMVLLQVRNADGNLYAGSPVAGVVTSVSVKTSSDAGTLQVTFEHQSSAFNTPTNFTEFTKYAPNLEIAVPSAAPSGVITTVPTRTPILIGDRLGVEIDASNVGILMLQPSASSGACAYGPYSSSVAVGTARNFYSAGGSCGYVPSIRAVVEPDADGDFNGDETQDFCPTDATKQVACPPIIGPGLLPATPPNLTITAVKSNAKTGTTATRSYIVKNIGGTAAAPLTFSLKSSKSIKKFTFVKGCSPAKGGKSCTIARLDPTGSATIKIKVAPKTASSIKLTAKVATSGETVVADNSVSTTVKFKLKK